jgi:hypothetical protein
MLKYLLVVAAAAMLAGATLATSRAAPALDAEPGLSAGELLGRCVTMELAARPPPGAAASQLLVRHEMRGQALTLRLTARGMWGAAGPSPDELAGLLRAPTARCAEELLGWPRSQAEQATERLHLEIQSLARDGDDAAVMIRYGGTLDGVHVVESVAWSDWLKRALEWPKVTRAER